MIKKCFKCGATKALTEFYIRNSGKPSSYCKPCVNKTRFEDHLKNPSQKRETYKKYYEVNKDDLLAKARARAAKRGYRTSALVKRRWRKAHPALVNAWCSKRRASKLNATPKWANHFFIEEIYELAQRRSKLKSGGHAKWHVDHIVPLQSRLVCGLHVEHNLQVIPAIANRKKHNKFWPDMP